MSALVENITAPVKAIAGPWGHRYPHDSQIGPSIGYLQEAIRWWDHWLKGIDRGVERDPDYRAYVMESDSPDPSADHREGRWIAEERWPSPHIENRRLLLGPDGLGDSDSALRQVLPADLRHGEQCGEYYQYGLFPAEFPGDQAPDDARSACFDSAPLTETLEIVGAPSVRLRLSADRPRAQVVVRLCDLRPDGTSMLITMGLLNLRHRNGFERTEDLTPGDTFEVMLTLDQAGYRIPAGHQLRLGIASSYWPYVWPEPELTTLTLEGGVLDLPLRPLAESEEWTPPPRSEPLLRV